MSDAVDSRWMSASERAEYSRLSDPKRLRFREGLRAPRTWIALAVWCVVTPALYLAWDSANSAPSGSVGLDNNPRSAALFFLFLLFGIGGMMAMVVLAWTDTKRLTIRYRREFLERIDYASRGPKDRGSNDDDQPLKSRRRLQHEWYGDHSELTWRDREVGEMHGIDADTYVSNVLENDKD